MKHYLQKHCIPILLSWILFTPVIKAQTVTGVYTDFRGYWSSKVGDLNPVKVNDRSNLLAFTTVRTINGSPVSRTFSTGVNDAALLEKGVDFVAGDYKALPIGRISGTPTTNTFVGLGDRYNGVVHSASSQALAQTMDYYLTDGSHGLDMATAVFNIQGGNIEYKVDEFNIAAIGDNMPDIIATQMGDYPSATDVFRFIDINGNTVGRAISLNFSQVFPVGTTSWAFYSVPVAAPHSPIPYGGPHGDRLIRVMSWDLSDFGINENNVGSISRFVHTLSGVSDQAFMAYNTTSMRALTSLTPGCEGLASSLWLQANDGVQLNNGQISNWNNQRRPTDTPSTPAVSLAQNNSGQRPDYLNGSNPVFNFNPYAKFINGKWLGAGNSSFSNASVNFDIFVVGKGITGNGKVFGVSRSSADFSGTNRGNYPGINLSPGGITVANGSDQRLAGVSSDGTAGLWQLSYNRASSQINAFHNGATAGSGSGTLDLGTWYMEIGNALSAVTSDFELAEILVIPDNIGATQRSQISSYLAIKYGITLPYNYVSGTGTTIWNYDNGGYHHRIIGVGRDDCQGLAQKQSTSVHDSHSLLTVGMTALAATNKDNLTPMANSQFLIWGDNNGSRNVMTPIQAGRLCLVKPEFTWRNQRTGNYINTQATQVKIHVSEFAWNEAPYESEAQNYYLLIDRNSNGSYTDASDEVIMASSLSGGYAVFNGVVWDSDNSGTDLFTVALKVDQTPELAAISGSSSVCIDSEITLTNSFTGGVWSSSNPAVASVDSEGKVTGLSAGTTEITYSVTNARGCSSVVTREITVASKPTAVISGGGIVCEGEPIPDITVAFTGQAPWSLIYSNGTSTQTVTDISTTPYIISNASAGHYTIAALSDPSCSGTFSGIADLVIVNAPQVNVIQPACVGDAGRIEVTAPVGGSILYTIDGSNYQASPVFENLSEGSYTVTASLGNCTSSGTTVTINSSPTAPTLVITQPSCLVATGSIAVPAINGATYSIDNGQTFVSANTFNNLPAGIYDIVIKLDGGCEVTLEELVINAQPETPTRPTATSPVVYCFGEPASPLSASGTNLLWYTGPNGGVGNTNAPVPATNTTGTRLYYVSQTNAQGCESPRAEIEVVVKNLPATPNISVENHCDGTSILSAGNYSTVSGLRWSTSQQSIASITVTEAGTYTLSQVVDGCQSEVATVNATPRSTPPTPIVNVVNNCNGTSTMTASGVTGAVLWSNGWNTVSQSVNIAASYSVIQTVNGCASAPANVTTAPKSTPAAPAAANQNFCASTAPTVANLQATGSNIKWYIASTGGNALTPGTALISGKYFASQTGNECESSRREITVTINNANAPTGPATQNFCISNNPTVSSLNATGNNIRWYTTSASGTPLATQTALVNGATYYATSETDGCQSAARLAVTVNVAQVPVADAGEDQTHCNNPDFIMTANPAASGTGSWSVKSGFAQIAQNNEPGTLVTIAEGMSATLVWTVSNSSCTSTSEVTLTNRPGANAGADQELAGSTFTMAANHTEGLWEIVSVIPESSSANVTITDPTLYNTTVSIPAGSEATLRWTVSAGGCSDVVTLKNTAPLPVELVSFSGNNVEGIALLHWETASEFQNAGFEIQKSTNGTSFVKVGFVEAQSTGTEKVLRNYLFADPIRLSSAAYYRLQQFDLDGSSSFSTIIRIDAVKSKLPVVLSPNPAREFIQLRNIEDGSKVSIFNSLGQILYTGENRQTVDVSYLPAGIYHLLISKGGSPAQTIRFVKE